MYVYIYTYIYIYDIYLYNCEGASVVADAFLPNLQQQLFDQGGSPLEVCIYVFIYI